MFVHSHKVQFYETDLMGVVHHSNYLRFFEEARVAWAHKVGLIDYQQPTSASQFAVYETHVKHLKPAFFGDDLKIEVEAMMKGVRILFQYRMVGRNDRVCALARTEHVALGPDLKLIKLPASMKAVLENEKWTETWL